MKNVLVVAYYFPPYALVSAVRITKFCKYLPHFGWQPLVLTVDPAYYSHKIVKELPPEVGKIRAFRIPFYRFPGCVFLLKLLFPILIVLFTFRHRKNLDAVIMTGSPYHPFISSVLLKGILRIPTYLDFRDAWSFNHGFDGREAKTFLLKLRQHFFSAIERISIQFASGVIFATDILQAEYSRQIPFQTYKFYTVTNGYDPDDFISVRPTRITASKNIILTGQFYLYTPEVVEGLMLSLKFFPSLHFTYIGNEHELIAKMVKVHNMESQVTTIPYLSYQKLLMHIAGADYGLVTTGMPNILGTKIFDYLALGKPTLCFVPKDSMISRKFSGQEGVVISEVPHTIDSIKQGLITLMNVKERIDIRTIKHFSRKECAGQLARILQNPL